MGESTAVMDKVYTANEVADLLRVSAATVRRWCAEGRVPAITTFGGHLRIPAEVVAKLTRPTTATTGTLAD